MLNENQYLQMAAVSGLNYFEKSWGHEFWFANTEKYCGKKLFVVFEKWSSKGKFHYHQIKDETFFVMKGNLVIDFCAYLDDYEQIQSVTLVPGQSFRIKPKIRHRFTSSTKEGCTFIEASTHHDESDSYRCYWDFEKKSWWTIE
jgi:mannose-6-phosphate isomerase-like protein (cupin superfamily)